MKGLKFDWRSLLAVSLLLTSNVVLAALGGSATPFFPVGTAVGTTNIPVRLELAATGDAFPAIVVADTIKLTMSCGENPVSTPWNCTGADVDLGVFSIVDTTAVPGGSANANEVCNGKTFDFGAEDATTGKVDITPSSAITFTAVNQVCTINFAVNVDQLPAQDASNAGGIQTAQGGLFALSGAGQTATGTGSNVTTVGECSVEVDKQVSCDGGDTWVDAELVTANEDGTGTCNGLSTDKILVRYQAQNTGTGCALTGCTWVESNDDAFGQPDGPFDLLTDAVHGPTDPASSAQCSSAFGDPENPEEPDSISITCDAEFGDPVEASDTAGFGCLTVAAKVDRNVSCDGSAEDQTLVTENDDETNGCTTLDGNPVNWGYQACNDGTAPLYDCTLVDANTAVSDPIVVGDLAPSGCGAPNIQVATNNPLACSTDLEAAEAANGEVTLTCCTKNVDGIVNCDPENRVSVFDRSNVTCETQSGLEIVKECIDDDLDGTDDKAKVTVSAGIGDLGFTDCVVSDTIYLDNATCSEDPPGTIEGTPTVVALTPGDYSLAPEDEQESEGPLPVLTADACNTASVTCTEVGTGDPVTEDAAPVICDFVGEGCITRTAGYWGTHPHAAETLLDIEVCGKTLASVEAMGEDSTTEAICSVGRDGKILGSQVTQLIRQCTAAALNHAVSAAEEGSCTQADEANFAACCGQGAGLNLCSAQDDGGPGVTECIVLLDEFNNSLDTLQTDWFDDYNPADSSECRASKNNGFHPYVF